MKGGLEACEQGVGRKSEDGAQIVHLFLQWIRLCSTLGYCIIYGGPNTNGESPVGVDRCFFEVRLFFTTGIGGCCTGFVQVSDICALRGLPRNYTARSSWLSLTGPPNEIRNQPPNEMRNPPRTGIRNPAPNDIRNPPPNEIRNPPLKETRSPPPSETINPAPDEVRKLPPNKIRNLPPIDKRSLPPNEFMNPPPDEIRNPPPNDPRIRRRMN
jgi:hypothetical protein